ncbi:sigma-70 family RNA polymerase sigma factor [Reinekea forsetii]|nr:sigma-70 family RNA polymerase sigma factor [Reinekea forsetii]
MSLAQPLKQWWQSKKPFSNATELTDAELLVQYIQHQHPQLIEALISRHGDALYHFLLTLADAFMAEDVSQHTWLKVIEKPNAYQHKTAKFRTWLFTLGRNGLIDELRRLARWEWQPIEDDEVSTDDHDDNFLVLEREGLQQAFDESLMALPFAQREALMLQLEGFALEDISTITGDGFETIKSRIRFARKTLKERLEVMA